jgi:hypothetical protein
LGGHFIICLGQRPSHSVVTWKHNNPAGWAWLLFAGISVLVACVNDLPKLIAGLLLGPGWGLVFPLVNVLSIAGLAQYAVRWRSPRATRFWRCFGPIMLLTYTLMISRGLSAMVRLFGLLADAPLGMLGALLAFGILVANTVMIAIAVLRLGDHLGPTRRPLGQKPAQLSLSLS